MTWLKATLYALGLVGGIGLLCAYLFLAVKLVVEEDGWEKAIGIGMLVLFGLAFFVALVVGIKHDFG
jgi:hypothetical protein